MRWVHADTVPILISSTKRTIFGIRTYLSESGYAVVPVRMNGAVILHGLFISTRAIGAVRVYLCTYASTINKMEVM